MDFLVEYFPQLLVLFMLVIMAKAILESVKEKNQNAAAHESPLESRQSQDEKQTDYYAACGEGSDQDGLDDQSGIDFDSLEDRNGVKYTIGSDIPYTGFTSDTSDGQLVHGEYKKGLMDGEWTISNTHGQMQQRFNYRNGEIHGDWFAYDENGRINWKKTYKDGKLHGDHITYYDRMIYGVEQIQFRVTYNEGKKQELKAFHENGEISSHQVY